MVEHERTGPVDMLNWAFSRIAMWGPLFIVAIIFYEVFMRYILFKPTLWVNEMSLWVGGAIYVTAGLYSMQQRSHIRIFVLYDMAPLWLRRVFDVISALCVCIFVFAVVWGGFGEAAAKFWRWEKFGTAFDPPIPATMKPLVLITLLLLALQAISNLIRDWPSIAIVRKAFDIFSVMLLLYVGYLALPTLLNFSEEGPQLPNGWRIGIGLVMAVSAVLLVVGLIRDFNTTPDPNFIEEDEFIPDVGEIPGEILSGDPPKPHDKV